MTCSKDRRPPFRRPRKKANPARLERAASGVADLRSDPSELRVQNRKRRRCDSNAQGRSHARRLSTPLHYLLCGASEVHLAEGAGVEPTEAFAPTVFGTARPTRAQPSRDASGGIRTPLLLKSDSFTGCCLTDSASDARFVSTLRRRKTDEGGERETLPAFIPQGNSVVKQQNKRSGPLGFPRGSRPAPRKSLRTFSRFGEREAAPR